MKRRNEGFPKFHSEDLNEALNKFHRKFQETVFSGKNRQH